jgi:hypothetical protein
MGSFLKDELVRHIEAYAASKSVDNELLQRWAASQVSEFLNRVEVAEVAVEPNPVEAPPVEVCPMEPADG